MPDAQFRHRAPPTSTPSTASTMKLLSPGLEQGHTWLVPPSGALDVWLTPQSIGRPAPSHEVWDYFRADVHGHLPDGVAVRAASRVVPDVGAQGYRIRLAIPAVVGTELTLTLFLQQSSFSSSTLNSTTCTAIRDPASAVASAEIRVKRMAVASQAFSAPVPIETGWYGCDREARAPTRSDNEDVSACSWRVGEERMRSWTPAEAQQCLANRWIVFIGDSTMEELAMTTALIAGAPRILSSWTRVNCTQQLTKIARSFDTGADLDMGIRITMLWGAAMTPCDDFHGVDMFQWPQFRHIVTDVCSSETDTLRRRPVVVFNAGLHDLASHLGRNLSRYIRQLEHDVLPVLNNVSDSVIWKTSNPKTGEYACRGHGYQNNVGNAAVQALDAAAASVLAAHQSRWRILDQFQFLLPLHSATQVHQHHCTGLFFAENRTIDLVYDGCIATAAALLHLLCGTESKRY